MKRVSGDQVMHLRGDAGARYARSECIIITAGHLDLYLIDLGLIEPVCRQRHRIGGRIAFRPCPYGSIGVEDLYRMAACFRGIISQGNRPTERFATYINIFRAATHSSNLNRMFNKKNAPVMIVANCQAIGAYIHSTTITAVR